MSTEVEAEGSAYVNQAEVALTAGFPTGARVTLGADIQGFLQAYDNELRRGGELEWLGDQLGAAYERLTGNQAGTVTNPNSFTTSAAAKKDDSVSSQLFSLKGLKDLEDGARAAMREIGAGLTKGLGSTALKLAAAAAVIGGLYLYFKKRGVL